MKVISFLLPGASGGPGGGTKVVVEYANRFAEDGFDVNIVYPSSMFFLKSSLRNKVKSILRYFFFLFTKGYSSKNWIYLNPKVKEHWVFCLSEKLVPKSDTYFATAVGTAIYLNSYCRRDINKLYLIQDYENWTPGIEESTIWETFRYSMIKVVISRWLEKLLLSDGIACCRIPNGFDFDYFKLINPIDKRDKYTISLLFHTLEKKGINDGIAALEIVKKKYPQLKVIMFGTNKRPNSIPSWYEYIQRPNRQEHNRIYNDSAIFVGTSHSEGWGLTIGEAMICGCAVVCTDNLGYQEMAIMDETASLVPIKCPQMMANAIISLIEDDNKRIRLARKGHEYIQQFKWDNSYAELKKLV